MSATARELYQAGRLSDAVVAQTTLVKERPADVVERGFLVELLCFAGALERADLQLDLIAKQDPDLAVGVAIYRQALRAEQARMQLYSEGRVPNFVGPLPDYARLLLEASVMMREGRPDEAERLAGEAEVARPRVTGILDGRSFADIRDMDDMTGGLLEVFTADGHYYWVPLERVALLEFAVPERPRDLLWRPARIAICDGPEGDVFVPVVYPLRPGAEVDDTTRLGRATRWIEAAARPVCGIGQRMYLVDDADVAIMQMRTLEFAVGVA